MKESPKSSSFGQSPCRCRSVFLPNSEAVEKNVPSSSSSKGVKKSRAFTILELLVVTFIIVILVSLSFPLYGWLRNKAETAACAAKMKSLFAAFQSYVVIEGHWPQPSASILTDEEKLMDFWVQTFTQPPYDIPEETWMCPTYERLMSGKEGMERKSCYAVTLFDAVNNLTPYRYENQPWLMEIGDHHGDGALILRPDGSVKPHPLLTGPQ